jgi:hypothetical protein
MALVQRSPSSGGSRVHDRPAALLQDRRPRLRNSTLCQYEIENVLENWLQQHCYVRDVGVLLEPVALRWTQNAMPHPRDLCLPAMCSLALAFAIADPTLNPGKCRTQAALVGLHRRVPCLFGQKLAERVSSEHAATIRLCLSKYRTLAMYEHKWISVRSKAFREKAVGERPRFVFDNRTNNFHVVVVVAVVVVVVLCFALFVVLCFVLLFCVVTFCVYCYCCVVVVVVCCLFVFCCYCFQT